MKTLINFIVAMIVTGFIMVHHSEAAEGIACRVRPEAVIAYVIQGGDRVDFNKTIKTLNVTALSFMPKTVSDRIGQITKEDWTGGVLVEHISKDNQPIYMYVQRINLVCP